jgi:hypothetical protein
MAGPDPAIHVLLLISKKDVDARVKPGHDELEDLALFIVSAHAP